MSLIGLLLLLVVIGVGLYLLNQRVPMEPWVKTVINVVAVILVILLLLQAFGFLDELRGYRVPQVR